MSATHADARLRVFIVDDSRIVRRLIAGIVGRESDLEVVGEADCGEAALRLVPEAAPDVVTLDVNMPGMNGVATLRALRERLPDLRVVMFSSTTFAGARTTLDALAAGAADVLAKPTADRGPDAFRETVSELVEKVRAVGRAARRQAEGLGLSASYTPFVTAARRATTRIVPFEAVVVAASTGGPNALVEFFKGLPADLPVPVLVAQHMPALFTTLLAERLDQLGPLRVVEPKGGELVEPGRGYIAPGDRHLGLERRGDAVTLRVFEGPRENGCRPAADVLFRDAAAVYGAAALCVVLTGMGTDGLHGAEALRSAGARVLAQDEATSAVWGMPGAVVRAGLAEAVLPLDAMADAVAARVMRRMTLPRVPTLV